MDPYGGSARPRLPQSWNRYAYVLDDPVNFHDPLGLDLIYAGSYMCKVGVGEVGETAEMVLCEEYIWTAERPIKIRPPTGGDEGGGPGRPECDRSNPANARVLNFIDAHKADAAKIGAAAGIPKDVAAQFVLAVAAEETLWGTSGIVENTNNFFGLHVNNARDTHHFDGQTGVYMTKGKPPVAVAVFAAASGFLDSGMGFVSNMHGLVSGVSDPAKFADILHGHGYGTTNRRYESELEGVIDGVSKRWNCGK